MATKTRTDRTLVRSAGACAGAYLGRRLADDDNSLAATLLGAALGYAAAATFSPPLERRLDLHAARVRGALVARYDHEEDDE